MDMTGYWMVSFAVCCLGFVLSLALSRIENAIRDNTKAILEANKGGKK